MPTATGLPRVQRLLNMGNTCFVNSALQALASFDLFFDYLSMTRENQQKCKVASTLLEDLTALKEPLNDYGIRAKLNSVPVVEEYFIESMEQQDSSEFITFLMEWVDTEVRDTLKILQKPDLFAEKKKISERIGETENYLLTKEGGGYHVCSRKRSPAKPSKKDVEVTNSLPDNTSTYGKAFAKDLEVSGKVNLNLHDDLRHRRLDTPTNHPNPFAGTVKSSLTCENGHVSPTYVNFLHLSVPINRTLEDCFREYTKVEEVEWNCEVCKEEREKGKNIHYSRVAKKQLSIGHPPKILCVHFQRLVHRNTSRGFGARKLDTAIKLNLEFNISPYCTGPLSGEKPTKIMYDLRAIIVHLGGSAGGHYVTYKRYSTDYWVYISDDEYRSVSTEEALNVPAFMLFYSISK